MKKVISTIVLVFCLGCAYARSCQPFSSPFLPAEVLADEKKEVLPKSGCQPSASDLEKKRKKGNQRKSSSPFLIGPAWLLVNPLFGFFPSAVPRPSCPTETEPQKTSGIEPLAGLDFSISKQGLI